MINFSKFNSLFALVTYFDTPAKCKKALAEARWADGDVICPFCGQHHCYTRKDGSYRCPNCEKNFSVLVGTIFENTKISLVKWFMAMYLISSHKKGVSSCQLSRDLGITQKSAWYILHKVRTLYAQNDCENDLRDFVECDEMYLGGRETNKHASKKTDATQGRSTKTKTPIFGMAMPTSMRLQTPTGKVRFIHFNKVNAIVVPDTKADTLKPIIEQFVREGSIVVTDELAAYKGLDKDKFHHEFIKHSDAQYTVGMFTTNTIEGFWGHFKRSIFGIYHFVGKAYVQRYIDESVYRYNTKDWEEWCRFADMFNRAAKRCRYSDVRLTPKKSTPKKAA